MGLFPSRMSIKKYLVLICLEELVTGPFVTGFILQVTTPSGGLSATEVKIVCNFPDNKT